MIPISLTLEGLYSYQERQVICFDTLIEAGLFGIFGKVGSGKSSLLEAISFALYGETERLNAKDNRAYNMMNLKSNRSILDFEFYNFEEKKYRVFREFKRNSKRFEDVKRTEAVFYEWVDEQWKPLDHINAELVLGLSYENFKRTIIIPQGKFKEFIELGGTARTKMMQELFGLERYDLADKVRGLYLKNKEQLDKLEGGLQAYEGTTLEHIEMQERLWKEEVQKQGEVAKVFAVEGALFQQLKVVKEIYEELQRLEVTLASLEALEPSMVQEEEQLLRYEWVEKNFKPSLVALQNLKTRLAKFDSDIHTARELYTAYEKEFKEEQAVMQKWEPSFKTIEVTKKQVFELGLIATILKAEDARTKCSLRLEKGEPLVKEHQQEIKTVEALLQKKQEELKELRSNRVATTVLLEVGHWFSEHSRLKQQLRLEQEKCSATTEKIKSIAAERKQYELEEGTWKATLDSRLALLQKEGERLKERQQQLEVSQQLSQYSSSLQSGEACPLCGSLEHPTLAIYDDVHAELHTVAEAVRKHQAEVEAHGKLEREMESISERIRLYEIQYSELVVIVKELEVALEKHLAVFTWKDFAVDDEEGYKTKRTAAALLEKQLETWETAIETEQRKKEVLNKKLEVYVGELDKIRKEALEWQMQTQTLEKQLDVFNWKEYTVQGAGAVEVEKKELEKNIHTIEREYNKAVAAVTNLQPKMASQNALLEKLIEDHALLKLEREAVEDKITTLLTAEGFKHLDEVEGILKKALDSTEIRTRIQAFKIELGTLRNGRLSLQEKLETVTYEEESYRVQELKVKELELQVKEVSEKCIQYKAALDGLKAAFDRKKDLLLEQEKLQKRAETIQVMSNMFKASGFVNYVSAIYLKNLCDRANVRFHRLTKNQLSLQLNENNDFEILDYLNNGKTRSVKTLSGGQSFQVSLSLALALAESVQSLSKSNRNFFFIDEGFGTQDSESVDIVFETLQNLHKENRIVGIISHVEELQERIPVSLMVTKDMERGSVITKSYE